MIERSLVLGIDLTRGGTDSVTSEVETMVSNLINSDELREKLSRECETYFDGLGKARVVEVLEKMRSNET
jgi:hypothetical protein